VIINNNKKAVLSQGIARFSTCIFAYTQWIFNCYYFTFAT